MMKKLMSLAIALFIGVTMSYGQTKTTTKTKTTTQTNTPVPSDIALDASFEDAGKAEPENLEYHLAPKFYKSGETANEQAIALADAKVEAVELAKEKPTQLRKDVINIIYTADPVYNNGAISKIVRGTIIIKWDARKRSWVFSYVKYTLAIDQNVLVFRPEI